MSEQPHPELRLALAMNGGISLAVWIGGVCDELLQLCQAGRGDGVIDAPDPQPGWTTYQKVCWAAGLQPRVDVLSGASAGGMNGVFLALALIYDKPDLTPLRDLWLDAGDFTALLRDPLESAPPSLMRGDEYFLVKLEETIRALASGPPRTGAETPVDLTLTVTSMEGKEVRYEGDRGHAVVEREHAMTLRFRHRTGPNAVSDFVTDGGDQGRQRMIKRLARACRSTASFPGAFEPSRASVGKGTDEDPPDAFLERQASFRGTVNLIDGGALVNLPVGEALQAIFDLPATGAVRRVFAMVVPDPTTGDTGSTSKADTPPSLINVATSALSAIPRNQTVGRFLNDLEESNSRLSEIRVARVALLSQRRSDVLAASRVLFSGYVAARAGRAQEVAEEHLRARASDVDTEVLNAWRTRIATTSFPWIPAKLDDIAPSALNAWGRTTVRRSAARLLHLLSSAEDGSQPPDATVSAAWRTRITATIEQSGAPSLSTDVTNYFQSVACFEPPAGRDLDTYVGEQMALLVHTWTAERLTMGDTLADLGGILREMGPFTGLGAVGNLSDDDAVRLLLALEVIELTFAGFSPTVEQPVEILRIDTMTTSPLDTKQRDRAAGKVAGVQLGHFGSFLRASWRANDWMWGRLDGSARLIEVMLRDPVPGRLARLRTSEQQSDADVVLELVAERHQTIVLTETESIVKSIKADREAGGATTRSARALESAWQAHDASHPSREQASALLSQNAVGSETLADQAGSDHLTLTSMTALATGATVAHRAGPKVLATPIASLRYVLLLAWGMTRATVGGPITRALSAMVFGIGATIVAVSLLPGVSMGIVLPIGIGLLTAGALVAFARAPFILVPLLALVAVPLSLRAMPARSWSWWPSSWPFPSLHDRGRWLPAMAVIVAAVFIGSVRRPMWMKAARDDYRAAVDDVRALAGAPAQGVHLWHRVVVVTVALLAPAAKSWQVIAERPWLGDLARQAGIAGVLAAGLAVVIVREAPLPDVTHARRFLLATGLVPDTRKHRTRRWPLARWPLAILAAGSTLLGASNASDSFVRWILVGVAAACTIGLVGLELRLYRASRKPTLTPTALTPSLLWVTVPLLASGLVHLLVLGARGNHGWSLHQMFELLVVTAFGEELIFRGLLLVLAVRVFASRSANLLTALSFGLWHVGDAWNDSHAEVWGARVAVIVGTVVVTTMGGFLLSYLRMRARCLYAPVFAHVATNLHGAAH